MAEALRERAQRIYEKYGNVMLETAGMTKAGIERKATCRALFSKLLYLAGAQGLQPAKPLPAHLACMSGIPFRIQEPWCGGLAMCLHPAGNVPASPCCMHAGTPFRMQ